MSWSTVKNLYLTFSISFLALLTALFLNVSESYRLALFTTLSIPFFYTAKYYKEEYRHGKYFKTMENEALVELQILLTSFFTGYIMYVTTTTDFSTSGLELYAIAFAIVLIMKYVLQMFYSVASRGLLGEVNPDNPLVILAVSFVISCTFFLVEMLIFPIGGVIA